MLNALISYYVCRYTADEYFMEDSDSEESEDEAMSDEDPDWQKTPLFKRIKKLKETQSFAAAAKDNSKKLRLEEEEGDENQTPDSTDDTFARYCYSNPDSIVYPYEGQDFFHKVTRHLVS